MKRLGSHLAATLCVVATASGPSSALAQPAADPAKTAAEIAKLKEETKKLKSDQSFWGRLPGYGAVFAGLVALGGLFTTLKQQRDERRHEREKDRDERERESLRRFDEQFMRMVADLTSDSAPVRASAAASIGTFLQPQNEQFHEQVLTLLLANLKFPRGDVTDAILARLVAKTLREQGPSSVGEGEGLDLSEARLLRVDLRGVDLARVDTTRANLHGANLSGASLFRARGVDVDLSHARLVGANLGEARLLRANLEQADLNDANLVAAKLRKAGAARASFNGARLQDAHLEEADLRAASFKGANLNNAYFHDAKLDEPALRTMLQAVHWENVLPEALRERIRRSGTPPSEGTKKSGDAPSKEHPPTAA